MPVVALAASLAGGMPASAGYGLTGESSFLGSNGASPYGDLVFDSKGNLYGTTAGGPLNTPGAIFEVPAGTSTPNVVATFDGSAGATPFSNLIFDAAGNLFGTTFGGGAGGYGTVFELAAGSHTPTLLAAFNRTNGATPYAGLVADSAGNLYGTTSAGGAHNVGTVFEVTAGASFPTVLATFDSTPGSTPGSSPFGLGNTPIGGLVRDAAGNLYGTTTFGGANDMGTIFEVTPGSHAPTFLATFDGTHGANPYATLVRDAAGNLFGTTLAGGANNLGTVFELVAGSSTPVVLASFNGADGRNPNSTLVRDAAGNFFGTTTGGGVNDRGTVFELVAGSSTPTVLFSFDFQNGAYPYTGVVMDPAGNLFGTTNNGGILGLGTFFELSPSGGPGPGPGPIPNPVTVPEPSTLCLLGLGALALAGRAAMRRRPSTTP